MTDDAPPLDAATIRAALDQCMTLADIEKAMGWKPGTGLRMRSRPEPHGLPEPDYYLGRTPIWFRGTIDAWTAARPGGGGRPPALAPRTQPRARDRRAAPPPPAGHQIPSDGLVIPREVAVIAFVGGSWRSVSVSTWNRRSLTVRYRLEDEEDTPEHVQRVGIARTAFPVPSTTEEN